MLRQADGSLYRLDCMRTICFFYVKMIGGKVSGTTLPMPDVLIYLQLLLLPQRIFTMAPRLYFSWRLYE